jgi:hypothetical protein
LKKPYLSICIPTNGRIEILLNTLDSIFLIDKYYLQYFEVVITDNSGNNELLKHLFKFNKFENLKYFSSSAIGFMNIFQSIENGSGLFLKLHNNYTKFKDSNSIINLIELIKKHQDNKPLIYFTNGQLRDVTSKSYEDFDSFSYDLSFWNTWAMGFSIWKEDFENYKFSKLSEMFPHTSLLLCHAKSNKKYIINNSLFFINQEVPTKGGYNLFKTFCVDYLNLINEYKNNAEISFKTFNKIKNDLFFNFLIPWHYNTTRVKNSFTFDTNNIKTSVLVYYTKSSYYTLLICSLLFPIYNRLKSLFLKLSLF